MDVLTLRIELESLLADELGVYTFANGVKAPAISVRATGEGMLPATSVTGIEAILRRNPDLEPINAYQREVALRIWTLFLVDWSGSGNLDQVAGKVVYAYPGSEVLTVMVPEGGGPKHQKRVRITTGPDGLSGDGAT